MFKWFYTTGLALASILLVPLVIKRKGFKALKERFGTNLSLKSDSSLRLWVHAVSLGETKAVIPLIREIKKLHPEAFIIFSTTTETGQKEARVSFPEANRHIYLPFDLNVRKYVKEAKPNLVLISETDFWFNFLDEAKKQGAQIVLVNGKLSLKSLKFYKKVKNLFKNLFCEVDQFLVQSQFYKERFEEMGIEPERITVTGNLKLDADLPCDEVESNHHPVLVIGSTHDKEEALFIEALAKVWAVYSNLKVYLVPRHPQRFKVVEDLLKTSKIDYSLFSESEEGKLVLVDKMGELNRLYQKADLCFVAGSWTPKVGGHNILEPLFFGKASFFGPYMYSQPDFLDQVLKSNSGKQVEIAEIADVILEMIKKPAIAREMGLRGKAFIQESRGATKKTLSLLKI